MKNYLKYLGVFILVINFSNTYSQTNTNYNRENWLLKAEECKPKLTEKIIQPICIVKLIKDSLSFQGWTAKPSAIMDSLYRFSFKTINSVVVDFGNHYTGYFSFKIGVLAKTPDGPIRVKLTFGEVPSELATPFDPYFGGISRAWLQDEIINIMDIPSTVTLPRRYAFRYVKIELLGSSPYYDFNITDMQIKAVTSAEKTADVLSNSTDQIIKDIDKIGLNTLKECMQTVYEDGPKRDRRLWIGDMYLESLANSYTFRNFNLTKRCLYLFAGLSGEDGLLIGTVFETPKPHPQANQYLFDYSLLYNATLKEYVASTNDFETANDLWPVAKKQLDIIYKYLQPNGLIDYEKANKEWWLFFDWKDGLNKEASLQGLSVFALTQTYDLAKILNKQDELKEIPALIKKMIQASRNQLFNKSINLFESGKEKQISYASQIWMILGGVLSKDESQKTLKELINSKNVVTPGTPYLYHYFIQALVNSGMNEDAKKVLLHYWGGMVKKGADTFWEVYDPKNEFLSPYNFYPVNSYCHAWSCTPVYFIHKYPEIFQK